MHVAEVRTPGAVLSRSSSYTFALITALLASVYLLVYSARIESGDALLLVNAVSSWVERGDTRLDIAVWHRPPSMTGDFRLVEYDIEPLQVLLASPLYALAQHIPGVGRVQVVYLFNAIICALSGGVFYLYVHRLGHRERTAVSGALCLGLLTIVFPYSKTFFREPLMLLTLLLCAWCLEGVRRSGYRAWGWWVGAAVCAAGVVLTKASALLAVPALLLILMPSLHLTRRTLLLLGGVALMFGGIYLLLSVTDALGDRYDIVRRVFGASDDFLWTAVGGYLLSPGGSIWGSSPILLLALPALWWGRDKLRAALVALTLLLAFAFGYATLNGVHWFGGLSLPPRFLLPVVPFLLLAALPALDHVLRSRSLVLWGAFAALCAYSLWWQISGVLYWIGIYPENLPPQADGLIEWSGGLYDLRYLRPVVLSSLRSFAPIDFAWDVIGQPGWALAFAGLAASCVVGLWRRARGFVLTLPALLLLTGAYMAALYRADDRYDARNDALAQMLPILDAETTRADLLILSSPRYANYFANADLPADMPRVVALPEHPGEQPGPEQAPFVRSDNPDALVAQVAGPLLHRFASEYERFWLLVEFSPELTWSVRPVERFLAAHYTPLRAFQTAPTVRLIEFSTLHAPDPFAFRSADIPTDLVYEADAGLLRLRGVTLSAGTDYAPDDVVAVSLEWTTDALLDADYTVALFLRAADGAPVAQTDWQPGFGFAPTSGWTPNVPVWDHRGVRLAPDLPPGEYALWVKVYAFADGAPRDLTVTGANVIDGVIGVLPVSITVR
jgi:hypothetical protein